MLKSDRRRFEGALASLNRPLTVAELTSEITFAAPRVRIAIAGGHAERAKAFASSAAHFALILLARRSWPARRAVELLKRGGF